MPVFPPPPKVLKSLVFWNKKDNRSEFIEMAIDIPKFTFSYRNGEIKLIKVWW